MATGSLVSESKTSRVVTHSIFIALRVRGGLVLQQAAPFGVVTFQGEI